MPVRAGQKVLTSHLNPPAATRCRAWSSAGVSATVSGTLTLVPLGAETIDTPTTMHSTVTNTSRIVVPVAGSYLVVAQIGWANNATGRRAIVVRKNAAGSAGGGTQVMLGSAMASPSSGTQYGVTDTLELLANDYLELFGQQVSGGTLDISSGEPNTFLNVVLLAPN